MPKRAHGDACVRGCFRRHGPHASGCLLGAAHACAPLTALYPASRADARPLRANPSCPQGWLRLQLVTQKSAARSKLAVQRRRCSDGRGLAREAWVQGNANAAPCIEHAARARSNARQAGTHAGRQTRVRVCVSPRRWWDSRCKSHACILHSGRRRQAVRALRRKGGAPGCTPRPPARHSTPARHSHRRTVTP